MNVISFISYITNEVLFKKLLDLVRDKIRFKHYNYSTERTYVHWIKQYIFLHNKKHPVEMKKCEIEEYLTFLATKKKVSYGCGL